ncbi:MAG TPA: response regulator, partial [Cyanobacteria bacterium UBA8553]|nr:response regulator [Cyanobacteria bacterium UBA8553]
MSSQSQQLTILAVDDSTMMQEVIKQMLGND